MLTARTARPPRLGKSLSVWAPAEHRDRFVDVLLVCAVVGVVGQHWLVTAFSYDNGVLTTATAFDIPGAATITWVGQLTPLLFFSGGAAAALSLGNRADTIHRGWLAGQVRRLALPVMPLLAVWLALPHLLPALGVPADSVDAMFRLSWGPVWVVALLVLLTAATPALVRLHRRWRGVEVLVMAGGAIATDTATNTATDTVFVWVTIYQIGIAYTSGSLRWAHGTRALAVAGAGLTVTVLAVAAGQHTSSLNPPTAVLLAITTVQVGLALALRPFIERWAASTLVTHPLDWLSARWMTIYLWHMLALTAVAGVAVIGLGWSTPDPLSAAWLREMPAWTAAAAFTLLGLIRLFERLERPQTTRRPVRPHIARERVGT